MQIVLMTTASDPLSDPGSYYRAMMADRDGRPTVGRGGRMLGVRVPGDILPDELGLVRPGIGGMSVAPDTAWNVPNHRRPRGMPRGSSGPRGDRMYAVAGSSLPAKKLRARPDPVQPEEHAFVEPAVAVELAGYENDLAETRKDWRQVWP